MKTQKNKQSIESLVAKINSLKFKDQKNSGKNESSIDGKKKYLLRKEKKLQRILSNKDQAQLSAGKETI